jgi:predicted PurR-regulated permease PerM
MRINRGKLILSVAVTFIFIVTATFTIKYRQEIKETAKPLFIALILYYVISPGVKFLTLRKVNKKIGRSPFVRHFYYPVDFGGCIFAASFNR